MLHDTRGDECYGLDVHEGEGGIPSEIFQSPTTSCASSSPCEKRGDVEEESSTPPT